jgi:hypothetical protein
MMLPISQQGVTFWDGQLLVCEPVGQGWRAQWHGSSEFLEITEERRSEIEAEMGRQATKESE